MAREFRMVCPRARCAFGSIVTANPDIYRYCPRCKSDLLSGAPDDTPDTVRATEKARKDGPVDQRTMWSATAVPGGYYHYNRDGVCLGIGAAPAVPFRFAPTAEVRDKIRADADARRKADRKLHVHA